MYNKILTNQKARKGVSGAILVVTTFMLLSLFTSFALASDLQEDLIIRYFALERVNSDDAEFAYAGDSILISTPGGKHLLIDSGRPEVAPQILDRLNELGVEKLDFVFASHPHIDHIGGFQTVLKEVEVEQFFQIALNYDSGTYRNVQKILQEQEIPHSTLEEGNILELEPGVVLEFFNPPAGTDLASNENLTVGGVNDLSLVFKLTYKDFSALFTGDIYRAREEYLVDKFGDKLQARFYDAPHHGQHTSSSRSFIRTVKPEVSVFSIELLGSVTTFFDLRELGSKVYVTGLNGEVVVRTDGQDIIVETEREIDSPFLR